MVLKQSSERSLAVFIDFENLALGFTGRNDRFDIRVVLKRLLEKGKIVAKKAYADWNRFSSYTSSLHEAAIELVEIPRRGQTGKNSADIRLCVDAMDLAYSKEHIDTFVVVSGDSDFSPLVSKLKELGKHVIGLGMSTSTSNLLRDNCDEFIYYEDLSQEGSMEQAVRMDLPDSKRKAFMLLLSAAAALRRDNKEILHPSQVKATMQRMKPSFNESYYGYRTFSGLLEDAQREGLLRLESDKKSGTYVITQFGSELENGRAVKMGMVASAPNGEQTAPSESGELASEAGLGLQGDGAASKPRSGRRRRGGRGRRRPQGDQGAAVGSPSTTESEASDEASSESDRDDERPVERAETAEHFHRPTVSETPSPTPKTETKPLTTLVSESPVAREVTEGTVAISATREGEEGAAQDDAPQPTRSSSRRPAAGRGSRGRRPRSAGKKTPAPVEPSGGDSGDGHEG